MKKQTAVEWLVEQIEGNILWNDKAREMLNQAKEMEKEQIMDACNYGDFEELGEQYYNETYNNTQS